MESFVMKQLTRRISTVFLAFTLATIVGCAENLPQESAGEYLDDAVITTKVKAAILDQPSLKSSEIKVETFKGTVQLRGSVASQSTIDQAVEVARSVNGVRSVKNDMRLR
jgi:osmotically-inducible protein OsmY